MVGRQSSTAVLHLAQNASERTRQRGPKHNGRGAAPHFFFSEGQPSRKELSSPKPYDCTGYSGFRAPRDSSQNRRSHLHIALVCSGQHIAFGIGRTCRFFTALRSGIILSQRAFNSECTHCCTILLRQNESAATMNTAVRS